MTEKRGGAERALMRAATRKPSRGANTRRSFSLELSRDRIFVTGVLLAVLQNAQTMSDSLADYPRWFVVACGTIVLAVVLWIGMKLLKVMLWFLIATVLVVGLG